MHNNLEHDGKRHDEGRVTPPFFDALDAAMVADPRGLRTGHADWHAMGRGYRATAWRVMGQSLRARRVAGGQGGRRSGQVLAMCLAVLLGAALHAAAAGPASPSCAAPAAVPDLHAG
jgi:hypothetical protein